jgi:S1-C subfamily serine protease
MHASLGGSSRGVARTLVALALLVGLAPAVRAGDGEDLRALEKTFKKVAADATPKTVCVKSYIEETGDQAGYGSGAIISADGYILTCAHVVDIAKRCEIILPNGKTYPATLLGKNKRQDYALVKIDAKELPFFQTGDSTKLSIGQWVMALGHPGGPYEDVQPAFAAGKITNLHRKLPVQFMDRFYDDGIQTDVPIFAGNSGGPLVSLEGKLIGLNGAIIWINDNAFAVPIHEALADLDTLKKGENVAGHKPSSEDMAEFQKQMDPEMMSKMFERLMKNMGGGKDNPLSKLFGGGKNGENPFGDLFGKDGGEGLGKMMKKLFGGDKDEDGDEKDKGDEDQGGQGMDLGKLMKQLQKMMGGKDGENPFGDLFGKDGQSPDLGKMMKQLQKMFGQGGEDDGDDDEGTAPKADKPEKPAKPERQAPAPPVDRGGFLGVKAVQQGKTTDGAIVDDVVKGSPAEKAGLVNGDVIVAVDGTVTPDFPTLAGIIKSKAPGTNVILTVDRSRVLDATVVHERVDVKLTVGARPEAGK